MKCKQLLSLVLSAVVLTNTLGEPIFSYAADMTAVESPSDETDGKEIIAEKSEEEEKIPDKDATSSQDLSATNPTPTSEPTEKTEETKQEDTWKISEKIQKLLVSGDFLNVMSEMKEDEKIDLIQNLTKEDGYYLKSLYQYGLVNKMVEFTEKKEVTSEDRKAFHSYVDTFNEIKSEKKDFAKDDLKLLQDEVLKSLTKDLDKEAKEKIQDHQTYMEYLQTTTKLDVTNAFKEFGKLWDAVPENAEAVTKEVKSFIDATFGFDEQSNPEKPEKEESKDPESEKDDHEDQAVKPDPDTSDKKDPEKEDSLSKQENGTEKEESLKEDEPKKEATTEEKGEPSEKDDVESVIVSKIAGYETHEGPLLDTLQVKKGKKDSIVKKLPNTISVNDGVEVPVTWKPTEDVEKTDFKEYMFQMVLPEGYEFSKEIQETVKNQGFNAPYILVKIIPDSKIIVEFPDRENGVNIYVPRHMLRDAKAHMPSEVPALLEGSDEPTWIPVTWELDSEAQTGKDSICYRAVLTDRYTLKDQSIEMPYRIVHALQSAPTNGGPTFFAGAVEGGQWIQDSTGWWYRNPDGSYPNNGWAKIGGKWFYFYSSGYMAANAWVDSLNYVDGSGYWRIAICNYADQFRNACTDPTVNDIRVGANITVDGVITIGKNCTIRPNAGVSPQIKTAWPIAVTSGTVNVQANGSNRLYFYHTQSSSNCGALCSKNAGATLNVEYTSFSSESDDYSMWSVHAENGNLNVRNCDFAWSNRGVGCVGGGSKKISITNSTFGNMDYAKNQGIHLNNANQAQSATITGNTFNRLGIGIIAFSGTKNTNSATINISNNTIRSCGDGIFLKDSPTTTANISNNNVSNCLNQGYIHVSAIKSATISGNTVSGGANTGVNIVKTTTNMSGNNIHSISGIGVHIDGGSNVTMTSGNIHDNKHTGVNITSGTLNLSGGSIYNNKHSNYIGGGIHVTASGKLYMTGGSIYSNSTNGYGGGICVDGYAKLTGGSVYSNTGVTGNGINHAGTLEMGGAANVNTNNDVYLQSGKYINVISALSNNVKVTPSTYALGTPVAKASYTAKASAIHPKFQLTANGNKTLRAGDWIKDVADNMEVVSEPYTVTYNANGGSGAPGNQTKYWNEDLNLSSTKPTKDLNTFKGWNIKQDGSGTAYNPGAVYTGNSSMTLYAQWTPVQHTNIIAHWAYGFEKGEGNNGNATAYKLNSTTFTSKPNETFVLDESKAISIPKGFVLGSTFGTRAIEGTWKDYPLGTKVTQKNNAMDFEYQYFPIDYTITYNLNGGTLPSGQTNPKTYNILYGASFTSTPSKSGYKFAGWYDTETNTKITGINEGVKNNFTSLGDMEYQLRSRTAKNVTVEARWTPISYVVKYNGNGATGGATAEQRINIDETKALTANGFTRTGYVFKNWNTQADGKGTAYTNQQAVKNLTSAGNTVTLYAQWTPITYTIKYNGNGATAGSTANSSHTYDAAKALTANGFTRTGYVFKNWNTQADGKGTAYTNQQSVKNLTATNGGTVNLYAQWTPITYTIKYNGNGATGGATANSSHTYDVAKALTVNGFTRTGYAFKNWNTQADGKGTTYTNQQSVKNLTATNGATVTLYAQWTPNAYTVKYNGNGATAGSTASSTHTYDAAKALTANGFSKTGYTFTGWNTQADGKGTAYTNQQSVKNLTATNGGTVNLYAQWKANTYTVKYNGNGATAGSTASSTHTYDVAKALTANGFTRTGYVFKNWNTQADGKGTAYTNQQSVKNLTATNGATVNLYAQWTPITYTIKYNGNGATGGATANSSHTYDAAKALTANGFTKTGYTFTGWNTQADGKGTTYTNQQSVKNLTATNGATVNLYAQWKANTYTVKYNGNGATAGSTASSTHTYDVAKALTANGFTKTGYTFTGWNTQADGKGTAYTNQQSVKNLTATNGATVNLYAQWKANTYTVKYNGNGATAGSTASSTHTYDVAKALTANGFTKTGYTFTGWNTQADGKGTAYTNQQSVKNLTATNGATVNLYAQWTPNKYTIEYNGNGATGGTTPSITHTYDKPGKIQENGFIRDNFRFVEWNTKPDGSGTTYTPGQDVVNLTAKPGDKIVLYAVWTEQIMVVYDGNGATSGTLKKETIEADDVEKAGSYTVKKNTGYTGYKRNNHTYLGWYESYRYDNVPKSKYFLESSTTQLSWQQMKDIMARQQTQRIAEQPKMAFFAAGFANIPEAVADTGQQMTMYSVWDEKPKIDIVDPDNSSRTFYEGITVRLKDLLKGVTVTDKEDSKEGLEDDLLKSLKIVKIEYAAGKLVNGIPQQSYVKAFPDGMPADATLDTWFMEMEKDAEVHHKITYQATDSVGNVTTAVGEAIVKYNNFPTITAEDRWFTVDEAQAGVITEEELLDNQIAQGLMFGKDEEEMTKYLTTGTDPQQICMLDFDAEEFTHFEEDGFRVITLRTQDTYGPNGKGKETIRQITVHVIKDGEIPDENEGKEVRFISKKYYDLNKDVDTTGMTEEEIEALNNNGGLRVDSVWYKDPEYRALIEATFEKKKGYTYSYTLEEVEQIKAFVDEHGIGNSKEPDALEKFEEQFGACTYE